MASTTAKPMMSTVAWPRSPRRSRRGRIVDLVVLADRHRVRRVEGEARRLAAQHLRQQRKVDPGRDPDGDHRGPWWQLWGYGAQVTVTVNGTPRSPWSARAWRAACSARTWPRASVGASA